LSIKTFRIDGGDFLCPSCKDMDKALTMGEFGEDDYRCVYCGITGNADNLDIVNIDYDTVPEFYKGVSPNAKVLQHNKTELEIISILQGMYKNIASGEVSDVDGMVDAIDLIKQEVGYEN
jgi:hypothetical protein